MGPLCKHITCLFGALLLIATAQLGPVYAQGLPLPSASSRSNEIATLEAAVIGHLAEVIEAEETGGDLSVASRPLLGSIATLMERSAAAGRSRDQVARRLEFRAAKAFGRDLPAVLKGQNGWLDIDAFIDQAGVSNAIPPQDDRTRDAYLSAIAVEGRATTVARAERQQRSPEPPAESGVEPQPQPEQASTTQAPPDRIIEEGGERFVVVRAGDTLGRLASELYGDFFQYGRLYAVNRSVIENPNLLIPGTRLLIP